MSRRNRKRRRIRKRSPAPLSMGGRELIKPALRPIETRAIGEIRVDAVFQTPKGKARPQLLGEHQVAMLAKDCDATATEFQSAEILLTTVRRSVGVVQTICFWIETGLFGKRPGIGVQIIDASMMDKDPPPIEWVYFIEDPRIQDLRSMLTETVAILVPEAPAAAR